MSNTAQAACFCVGKLPGCTCDGKCRCACTCAALEKMDWLTTVDKYEGQAVHTTRDGKGAVARAISKSKQPPNCS